jgi:hypothetical protein
MAPSRSRAARSRTPRRRCVRPARVARPRAVVWYVARCGTADEWHARCGARMLRRSSVVRCTAHAAGVESALYVASSCRIDACCIRAFARVASVHRRALHRLVLHRLVLHVANAQPSRSARSCSPLCGVWCACAARSGEGRAVFLVAERRRDALVRSPVAGCSAAACSP